MANNKNKTYWPHMIVGFLMMAIVLGYWTVKTASSMPVQETNDYMMKYQESDININEILDRKKAFDKNHVIQLVGVQTMVMTDNVNSKRSQPDAVKLKMGANRFVYQVITRSGERVTDLNTSFLLTRPHTTVDDLMIEVVPSQNGNYVTPEINITKPGRYTLQFRATTGDATGYMSTEAYLSPKE